MSGATIKKIDAIKEAMSKKVASVESLSDEDLESLKDMLKQLDSFQDVNLEVLGKTLIGTVVSKFKKHAEIGPTAKALVKKWKSAAKGEANAKKGNPGKPVKSSGSAKSDKTAAKPERRNSTNAATAEIQEGWYTLQPYRRTTCQKLHDVLEKSKRTLIQQGINADALDHLAVERATDIEMAIQKKNSWAKNKNTSARPDRCVSTSKRTSP
mmetsp:Transcript_10930/g.23149  ORF Transcript_10930/g.23149 Transcript_10930/m.23149 type:complete len:211 (+) Transcript_10930:140-772(+)